VEGAWLACDLRLRPGKPDAGETGCVLPDASGRIYSQLARFGDKFNLVRNPGEAFETAMTSTETDANKPVEREVTELSPLRKIYMKIAMWVITTVNMKMLQWSGYRLGYSFLGQNVVVLHTIGRKSGKLYRTPLFYMEDGDNIVLVASRAGTSINPGWLRNMLANPSVEIQFRSSRRRVKGRIAEGEEREQLWARLITMFEVWERIQERSPRLFPIIVLEPESPAS